MLTAKSLLVIRTPSEHSRLVKHQQRLVVEHKHDDALRLVHSTGSFHSASSGVLLSQFRLSAPVQDVIVIRLTIAARNGYLMLSFS